MKRKKMKSVTILGFVAAAVFLVASIGASAAVAAGSRTGFGFVARDVAGASSGRVALVGAGAFDPSAGFAQAGGGFRCTSEVVFGPLTGCQAGEGVRWDAAALLSTTPFKCTGSAAEAVKTASTGDGTVVLQGDFYRAGDGVDESFTAAMIVSTHDIAPDVDGTQTVWVQGVGCADAATHVGS